MSAKGVISGSSRQSRVGLEIIAGDLLLGVPHEASFCFLYLLSASCPVKNREQVWFAGPLAGVNAVAFPLFPLAWASEVLQALCLLLPSSSHRRQVGCRIEKRQLYLREYWSVGLGREPQMSWRPHSLLVLEYS